ncbi:LPP20 family lipoprotein [bacterium]|nr:LPP20 family lipoprotein [bacterium]
MKNITLFLVSLVLSLTSCTSAQKTKQSENTPFWLENPNKKFPQSLYLTSVGEGDTRKAAEQNAVASLSMIFEATIKAENTTEQRYKELFSEENSSFEKETKVKQNVKIGSSQTLFNLQFAESYTDKLGKTYVLAYLNRLETAEIYEEKISKNSEQIIFYTKQAEQTADPIKKYAFLNAASVVSEVNKVLESQLKIISPDFPSSYQKGYNENELSQATSEATKNIVFSVKLEGEEKVTELVKEWLSNQGFVVGENSILKINGKTNFEEIATERTEKFVRWSLNLNVSNLEDNTIVSFAESGRDAHLTVSEAKTRALRSIKEKIEKNFGKSMNNYFDKLVKK